MGSSSSSKASLPLDQRDYSKGTALAGLNKTSTSSLVTEEASGSGAGAPESPGVDTSGFGLKEYSKMAYDAAKTVGATVVAGPLGMALSLATTKDKSFYTDPQEVSTEAKHNPNRNVESVRSLLDDSEDDSEEGGYEASGNAGNYGSS